MTLNCIHFLYRFDLELENWGVDVNELKEIAMLRYFVSWTEDWEKEKWKVDGAINKVLFAKKYNDMHFVLSDTEMWCIEEGMVGLYMLNPMIME